MLPFNTLALAVAASVFQLVACGSHIETFSDASCQEEIHAWNGPDGHPSGTCTSILRRGNFSSFKITNLDLGCVATIYGPDTSELICSSNVAIVAEVTKCYNDTWRYYSFDECQKRQSISNTSLPATSSASTSSGSSSVQTSISSAAPKAPTATPVPSHNSGTDTGAIVGGVIGGLAFGVIVAAIGIISFLRYRKVKRSRPPRYTEPAPPAELASKPRHELDPQAELRQEMDARPFHEMEGTQVRAELPKSPDGS